MVQATLNHCTNQVSISIIGMNQNNPVYTRPADRYYANQLLEKYKSQIKNDLNKYIYKDANNYWSSNYRGKYSR